MEKVFLILVLFAFGTTTAWAQDCQFKDVVLKSGSKGEEVTKLQKFLVDQKLLKTNVFGTFGPATKKAVQVFQKNNKLKQSGILDQATIGFLNNRCTSQTATQINSTSSAQVAPGVQEAGPFKLEIFADKTRVQPDEQITFTVKLTNVSNATVTNYRLGQVDCAGYDLLIEPSLLFDGKSDFWPVATFNNYNPCLSRNRNNYIENVPPGKSFEAKVPYRNFSKSTTNQMISFGDVTEGDHSALAVFEIFDPSGKSIKLKSNVLKFYTVVDKYLEFPVVSINLKVDKTRLTMGEYMKMEASVKNVGKDDFQIVYGQAGNITEDRAFYIDGIYDDKFFFSANNQSVYSNLEQDTLFKNFTGTFKVGEEKLYSSFSGLPQKNFTNDQTFFKRVKGKHYIQFVVVYMDNFGRSKKYESNKVPFEVIVE